jgi:hypothetical protein
VLVSVPEQVILIGGSIVSTGSRGHATPGGVFSILEKKQEQYEDIRQGANAEHVALDVDGHRDALGQSARLSGEPRLHPAAFDFSQLLFSATSKGDTVVVGDGKTPVPHLASSPD